MERLTEQLADFADYVPLLLALAAVSGGPPLAHWLLLRRSLDIGNERQVPRQLLMLALTAIAVVVVLLVMPVSEETRGQLLGLLGVLLTATIALSSTTFVANTMAGLMLRLVKNFRPGEFVQVGDHFGRVTERGLFHTEIQTDTRDLTTLPNLYLISNPVTVVRSSGTIVDCTVSLGYDVAHGTVRHLLVEAGKQAGLDQPFVRVLELGDYSVSYRVGGLLSDSKELLGKRSEIRTCVLDVLHGAGVEIASPALEIQRRLEPTDRIVPDTRDAAPVVPDVSSDIVFDKAERAESLETMREARDELVLRVTEWEAEKKDVSKEDRERWDRRVAAAKQRIEKMNAAIEEMGKAED